MSELLNHFHFLRPWWLLAILPVGALLLALWHRHKSQSQWQQIIPAHLLPHLLENHLHQGTRRYLWGLGALWLLICLAMAGPAWQKLPQPVEKRTSALVILWDLSPSMMAEDIKPSRLMRARLKLMDLLQQRQEGITGLIAYAGEAHIVTPLTDDSDAIANLLSALSPDVMPLTGSNPEMALELAEKLLAEAGINRGDILFLTDGIDKNAIKTLQKMALSMPHRLVIWGIGSDEGAPIPLGNGGFARHQGNNIIVAKLNQQDLQALANSSRGYYLPVQTGEQDIQRLGKLLAERQDNLRQTDRDFDQWYEHGPYLLLLVLPFATLMFRRGWLLSLFIIIPMTMPSPTQAFEWQDLWLTPNQQGQRALEAGEADKAAEKFRDPQWQGTAHYKAGNYEGAIEAFQQGQQASDFYNLGNALAKAGRLNEAINAYDQALQQNPKLEDAQFNRDIVEQVLKQQQQQQSQDNQQNQNGENQEGDNSEQDGQQSGQENTQQNQSEANNQQSSGENDAEENNSQNSQANEQSHKQPAESANADTTEEEQENKNSQQHHDKATEASEEQKLAGMKPQDIEQNKQNEQQQALEQWLRKVPDDPSGLMRNKFRYQYEQRRRQYRQGQWRPPENDANQRW